MWMILVSRLRPSLSCIIRVQASPSSLYDTLEVGSFGTSYKRYFRHCTSDIMKREAEFGGG